MTLIDIQYHFSCFSLKISVVYFAGLLLSPGDLTKDDIAEWHCAYFKIEHIIIIIIIIFFFFYPR